MSAPEEAVVVVPERPTRTIAVASALPAAARIEAMSKGLLM